MGIAPRSSYAYCIWKQPDGRIASISPDVKVETRTVALNCYWIFNLVQGMQNGVWTLEVRVDGQPAGSHPFEIAGMEEPRAPAAELSPAAKAPTLDEIFRTVGPSLVWIRKLDSGKHIADVASGFVLAPDRIATSFGAIDGASALEVEFSDGKRVATSEVVACSRLGDWAILKVNTGSAAPILHGDPAAIVVGDRVITFNADAGAHTIGRVSVDGHSSVPSFGDRIHFSPVLAEDAVGGPLLDKQGRVVGILGGSLAPGARISKHSLALNPALWSRFTDQNSAIPLSAIAYLEPGNPKTLDALASEGVMTPPPVAMPEFMYGGTAAEIPKDRTDSPRDISEFSTGDLQVWIYSFWRRTGKLTKGEISAKVYDPSNRLRVTTPPKRVTLLEAGQRLAFGFPPSALQPGIYRVDLNWDGRPVWRAFVRINQ